MMLVPPDLPQIPCPPARHMGLFWKTIV